jgi:hypothetical protein
VQISVAVFDEHNDRLTDVHGVVHQGIIA